jgi:hypothetical protein
MADEKKIKALYGELQGILSQTPNDRYLSDEEIWNRYNNVVKLVTEATGEDYSRFSVKPKEMRDGSFSLSNTVFRQTCNGLIMSLHGEYFGDDIPPFSGPRPSNVNVSTTVSQSQAIYFEMILEFQSAMDKKMNDFPEGTKEREKQCWAKVKKTLPTLPTTTAKVGLVSNVIKIANECGLDINDLKDLF